jgi:Dynein heavy chain C-terminal domain
MVYCLLCYYHYQRCVCLQINGWSLDDLDLWLEIGHESQDGQLHVSQSNGFLVEGLTLEGASWSQAGGITLTDELRCKLPVSSFTWKERSKLEATSHCDMSLPMYLNQGRGVVVAVLYVHVSREVLAVPWAQRGVCVLLQDVVH